MKLLKWIHLIENCRKSKNNCCKISLASGKIHGLRYFSNRFNVNYKNKTNHKLITPWIQSLLQSGSVIVSKVDNIYDNLALEEWLYQNYDFSVNNEQILLLWYNRPAVVVGRHQNVWLEASIDYCNRNGIDVARRNSGGGSVYHDMNNLNISFITSRKCYDRSRNLQFIKDVLIDNFKINVDISPRKDLVIRNGGEKISGTASKLNNHNSYHHCTLLVDVDKGNLRNALRLQPIKNVYSNATKSVPSPTINLKSLKHSVTMGSLIQAISNSYSKYYTANKDRISSVHLLNQIDSKRFGSINEIRSRFQSWEWIFGSTPKFTICSEFSDQSINYEMRIIIEKGYIQHVSVEPNLINENNILQSNLIGKVRFEQKDLEQAFETIKINSVGNQIISKILLAIFASYKQICN
uniref:Lipoyltransferase 1, mitochondrial-like n=1 Tax=Dermatophagoides pteronyssinus TaxID=6956 RepID=A0A6P6Y2Q2_DERPT|nr:lipoyltransferase 1, mitochondrial-like [Dermatophagoides pteronyssinus]